MPRPTWLCPRSNSTLQPRDRGVGDGTLADVVAVFFGVELRLGCVQSGFGTGAELGVGGTYGEGAVVLDVT